MKTDGTMHPTDQVPVAPDTVGVTIGTSVGAVVAFDWPSGAEIVTFAGTSGFFLNMVTTGAHIPTTASSGATGSSERTEFIPSAVTRQITGDSTGYSLAFQSSGVIVTASMWAR